MVCNAQRKGTKSPTAITKDRWIGRNYRVLADGKYLDGRSVYYVDARRRIVRLYVLGANGKPYLGPGYELVSAELRPRRVRLVKKA